MRRSTPIDSGAPWTNADYADLRGLDWQTNTAEFSISNDERVMKVRFRGDIIVRMLDEFALSTEDDPNDRDGLVPHHFAYQVEGDPFLTAQSENWRSLSYNLVHYRFITGSGCLDVIADGVPFFTLVPDKVR